MTRGFEDARYTTTVVTRHRVGAFAPPDDRLRRVIQYSRDARDQSISRGVLGPPVKPEDDE
jgi:hypothetical protein